MGEKLENLKIVKNSKFLSDFVKYRFLLSEIVRRNIKVNAETVQKAVETAKEIESSAKTIYELEIKRVRVLYKKWNNILNEIKALYPDINKVNGVSTLFNEFEDASNKNKIITVVENNADTESLEKTLGAIEFDINDF